MGHRMKRKEDPRFIQGKGNYVDDVKLPGMLYMDIVRSPYAHAKITNIDASAALKIPGVLAVITGEDLKKAGNLHWMPTLMSDTQMVLPIEKVVYYAQEICVSSPPSAISPPTPSNIRRRLRAAAGGGRPVRGAQG